MVTRTSATIMLTNFHSFLISQVPHNRLSWLIQTVLWPVATVAGNDLDLCLRSRAILCEGEAEALVASEESPYQPFADFLSWWSIPLSLLFGIVSAEVLRQRNNRPCLQVKERKYWIAEETPQNCMRRIVFHQDTVLLEKDGLVYCFRWTYTCII